jgi:hypothetical protein
MWPWEGKGSQGPGGREADGGAAYGRGGWADGATEKGCKGGRGGEGSEKGPGVSRNRGQGWGWGGRGLGEA